MPDVPFPATLEGSEFLPKTRKTLKNCWNTGSNILPRPGITSLATPTGLARGSFEWNGALYEVFSNDLLKVEEDGTTVKIGSISGYGPIDYDVGFNSAVIIVREVGGYGYTLDATDTLTRITNSNYVACNAVTHINGRFVYIPLNGDPAFYSDVGNGSSIQPNSFFDAEELPDKNKTAINFKNVLFIGGTDSWELFKNTPGPTFVRLNGRIQNGFIGGLTEYAHTFAYIGRGKDQSAGIFTMGHGAANRISNEFIDTMLSTYTEEQLALAISGRFQWRGFDILTFTLPNHSFGYNGGWFELDTRVDNENKPWQTGFITEYKGKYYTAQASKIGRLDKINTDYGEKFERSLEFGFYNDSNDNFIVSSIEIGVSQGFKTSGTIGLQLSRDNILYGNVYFRSTGKVGQYANKLTWAYPGGLGLYEGFMGVRIMTTADIEFSIDKFTVNL